MVNALVGAVLGFLSGLGVGGGSLLLLWLTHICGASPEKARCINLMFFLPCALIATGFRQKQSKPDRRILLPAICAALAGTLLGSTLGPMLNQMLLKKAFGILFVICGIRELCRKEKPE